MEARIERVTSPGDADASESNAWIVGDDKHVIVVDPGRDADAVLAAVADREIRAVICTHGHAAHVTAASKVAARDEAEVALHPRDRLLWREAHADGDPEIEDPEIEMEEGGIFGVADVSLEVIHAPGHSPGSVLLYSEELDAVFAGDVVTAGGPVPHDGEYTDFPAQLSAIGEHLMTLPGATRVLPGHGEETTVAAIQKKFDSWVNAGPLPRSTDRD
jgi:glyoxylase-like metal-dependent hydrolase (beta-lactamase superfamily II)